MHICLYVAGHVVCMVSVLVDDLRYVVSSLQNYCT